MSHVTVYSSPVPNFEIDDEGVYPITEEPYNGESPEDRGNEIFDQAAVNYPVGTSMFLRVVIKENEEDDIENAQFDETREVNGTQE